MKAFVFLYPIKHYFDEYLVDHLKVSGKANNNFGRINDIIDVRYRQKDYNIWWVMFSKEDGSREPDLAIASNCIRMRPGDKVIASGISLKTHTEEFKYPDPEFILGQIPDLTGIVIGGFHQWDCVNKLASYAYHKGLLTIVDEDTTETFFERISSLGDVPLIRKEITFEALGLEGLKVGLFRKRREGKPWFTQI